MKLKWLFCLTNRLDEKIIGNLPISEKDKYIFLRRIKKIRREPKDFFKSSIKKRSLQLREKLPIKYKGENYFTVVSAVYNVENYLEDYLKSLTNQSLSFNKHIHLILIDDGSTDNSASIIKNWQKKYPKNITYLHKYNEGQASARNLGLKYVKSKWVTFIDPDDKIDINYFHNIDWAISRNSSAKILNTYIKFLSENGQAVIDKHPLKNRFTADIVCLPFNKIDCYINLSAASTFFDYSLIKDNKLQFDEKLKISFEDAKFIFNYMSYLDYGDLLYVTKSIYFYRKHDCSTTAKSWKDERKYIDTFKYGYLDSLEIFRNKPELELLIKKTVLYDINNYINFLIDKPYALRFLGDKEILFYDLLRQVIKKIDDSKLILESGISYRNMAFILNYMKKIDTGIIILPVSNINQDYIFHGAFNEKHLAKNFVKSNNIIDSQYDIWEHSMGKDTLVFIGIRKANLSKLIINV
jgi:glycosyltransferase involved in cell wall biosynthesis